MPQATLCIVFALALVAGGCGSAHKAASKKSPAPSERFFGVGADKVWVYRTSSKPTSVVVFLHGLGGSTEDRPDNHIPWLMHLARQGSAVLYPRYEVGPTPDVMVHILNGVQTGMDQLGVPQAPVVVIGYSRGARLAIEYAAVAAQYGRAPQAVLSVFPSSLAPEERPISLVPMDPKMRLVLMVGDQDTVVGGGGAREVVNRLRDAGFPGKQIKLIAVHSKGDFTADHFAPLQTSPQAKAAFWKPADKLVASSR